MGFKLWIGAGIVVSVLVMALVWQAGPTLVNRVERRMRNLLDAEAVRESRSIALARQHLAAERSARLVIERMPTVESFDSDFSLLEHSLQAAAEMDGLYCEFGVASGRTINFIAERAPDRTIHGFDSFEGLPQDWRSGFRKGTFRMDGLPAVRSNVELHQGWFNETLPAFVEQHSGPVSFVHLDADLYSSTKTVLDLLGPRFVEGTVLQFDEYFNYPGWEQGEFRAFEEFVSRPGIGFEYIGYCDGRDNF